MTVVTKPNALAQPRRHKARRRPQAPTTTAQHDEPSHRQTAKPSRPAAAAETVADGGVIGDEAGASGSVLMGLLAEPTALAGKARSTVADAAADEVVRSLLHTCSPAANAPAARGLTELLAVIQAPSARSAAPAESTAAPAQTAAQPAAANSPAPAAAPCAPVEGTEGGVPEARRQSATGEQGTVSEPAWRTRAPARGGREGPQQGDQAMEAQPHEPDSAAGALNEQAPARSPEGPQQHTTILPAGPVHQTGPGEQRWSALIAGLSFSAPPAAQQAAAATSAAARQLPHADAGASTRTTRAAEQPRPVNAADQAQAPVLPAKRQQPVSGRSNRMSELRFSAPQRGQQRRGSSLAPRAASLAAAERPDGGNVARRTHGAAQEQMPCSGRAIATTPDQAQGPPSAAAALRKRPVPEVPEQQDSGVLLSSSASAPKRQRGQDSGRGLWDIANGVMVNMAQRLIPGVPAAQSAPPQVDRPLNAVVSQQLTVSPEKCFSCPAITWINICCMTMAF